MSKTIQNDTHIAYELENFWTEIRLLNFCVGETLDSMRNKEHFHTYDMGSRMYK